MKHKDGHWVWIQDRGRLLSRTTDGQPLLMFGTHLDITEQKQAAAEREKLQIQSQQLQKAESLSRMAGAVAHHFNNQLAAVMLGLDLAKNDLFSGRDFPGPLKDAMLSARQAAEVSSLMLTCLGQTPCQREPLDLSLACQLSLTQLEKAMPSGVQLQANLPSPGPVIDSSGSQIQRVLTNLLTNAWEACGGGGGIIQLNVKTIPQKEIPAHKRFPVDSQPKAGAYACLEVTDNGCGIPAPDIDKIFDPFFSTKFTGRGLGLPVVLGIVRSHDGFIAVESQPEGWSVFRVFFPLSGKAIPRKPAATDTPSVKPHDGATVLLVEDESRLRAVVARGLKMLGFTVYEAVDGIDAVELFRLHQDEIQCVLTDLTMPRMNGWKTIAALRQMAPDVRVILASGYSECQVLEGAQSEMPQAFLSKPFDFEQLRDTVARVMEMKKA